MTAQANNSKDQSTLKNSDEVNAVSEITRSEPEKKLFSWRAPARPFKRRDRQFWVRLLTIAGVFGLILFLIEGVMPVILIISLLFLFYILSTVEPEEIEYTITNRGVKISDQTIDFFSINRFWFAKRFGSEVLILETTNVFGRLELMISEADVDKIRKTLSEYLNEEESSPARMDKVAGWVSKKISS